MAVYDILPDTNLKMVDIRDTLNANGGSVGNVLSDYFSEDANINKWAFWKPESYEKDFDLTDNDRYLNNHGFDETGMIRISVPNLFENASDGNAWKYILPSGTSKSPYRMGDFRKYNPSAEPPFDYRYINSQGASTSTTYSTTWRVVTRPNAEIKMSDLEMFDSLASTHYFFIARKNGTYIKSTLVSRSGDPSDIQCDITFPSTGTWEWIFCMGQNSSEDISSRLDVVLLPDGYGTFEFKQTYVFINITYTGDAVTKLDYDSDQYMLTIGNVNPSYSMVASNSTNPIADTVLEFGFRIHLLNSSKTEIAKNSVYSTDDNDFYTFNSANGTQTKALVNFPGQIDLKEYFSESDLYEASYLRFYPEANRVTGPGIPSNPSSYYEIEL